MTTELAKREEPRGLLTQEGITKTVEQLGLLKKLVESVLIKDADYGVIPGTGDKPTLLKPGADNVCAAFTVYATPGKVISERIDPEKGFVSYSVAVELISHRSGQVVSGGIGQCNSYEPKYRYRWVDGERQPNPDPLGQANTILKMAEKRAYVDATMKLPGVARFFTQDLEDTKESAKDTAKGPICPAHNKPFRKGKAGGLYCATKVGDGWCQERPSKEQARDSSQKPASSNSWSANGAVSPEEDRRAYQAVAEGFKVLGWSPEDRKRFFRELPGNESGADSWSTMAPRMHVEAAKAIQALQRAGPVPPTASETSDDMSNKVVEDVETEMP